MNLKSETTNAIKYEEVRGVSGKDVVAVSLLGLEMKRNHFKKLVFEINLVLIELIYSSTLVSCMFERA